MSPIDATLQRLGLASQSQKSLLGKRKGEMQASNSSSSSSAPAVSLNDKWKLGRVLGIVYDAVAKRLLYGIRWAPPYDDPSRDVWLPDAWIGNATDAQMTVWVKRKQPEDLPVVFSTPFTGPPDLDRQKAIPFDVVLQEVEKGGEGDGQGNGEVFEGRDTSGQEIVEEAADEEESGHNNDDNEEDVYAPDGDASLQYLEAARQQLQRAAAAQQRERVADTMSRVRNGLGASSASSAAGGRRDARSRSNPFSSSSSSSAAAGNSSGRRRWRLK